MTKAAETIQRIQYIKEHTTALEGLWTVLISDTLPSQRQFALWLNDYDYEAITQALKVTAKWLERQNNPEEPDAKVKGVTGDLSKRIIAYMGTCLRNAKILKMSPEDRAEEISKIRSLAGSLGNMKRWQEECKEVAKDLQEFAHVSKPLPKVATVCDDLRQVAISCDKFARDVDVDRGRGGDGDIHSDPEGERKSKPSLRSKPVEPTPHQKPTQPVTQPVVRREDFKSRPEYAKACHKAGVLPEPRKPHVPKPKPAQPVVTPEPPVEIPPINWDDYCDEGLCPRDACTCKPRESSAKEKAVGAFKGMEL